MLDETISLLSAHAQTSALLARMRAKGAKCKVWLTGAARRLEERMPQIEVLVSGSMPLSPEEIGPGFAIGVVAPGHEGWLLVESTGGEGFLAEAKAARQSSGLRWPLPDGKSERDLLEETFGQYIPPWMRADAVDRSDPPTPAGDVLVVPRILSASSAKQEVTSYLDTICGDVFVMDDGGPIASLLSLLNERMEDPRIRLATVVKSSVALSPDARGSIVILDASAMRGDGEHICDEMDRLSGLTDKPVLLLNPTGRQPSNDLIGYNIDVDMIAAKCASLGYPVIVCGHLSRLGPGDAAVSSFLKAGCFLALGSGGGHPKRCAFGLDVATAMAARAGARSRDIWRPAEYAKTAG